MPRKKAAQQPKPLAEVVLQPRVRATNKCVQVYKKPAKKVGDDNKENKPNNIQPQQDTQQDIEDTNNIQKKAKNKRGRESPVNNKNKRQKASTTGEVYSQLHET